MSRLVALLLAASALQDAPSLKSFDDEMAAFLKKQGAPGGSLAVVKDGRLVCAKGYGLADVDEKKAAAPESLFRIASVSKPVTAVAVLALVQKSRLDLEAKAFALLGLKPGEKGDPRLAEITVRHLLHHTGGWDRDKSGDPMFQSVEIAEAEGKAPPADAAAIIRAMLGRPLDFDPGTRHAYSNFGYCVLGRILEKVTGESYEAAVKKLVLEPMGITRMRLGRSLLKDRAKDEVRYTQPNSKAARSVFSDERDVPWPYGGFCIEAMDAHGGWIASAVDLARFASSLGKVLDATSIATMFERPAGLKPTVAYYGCGWMVRPVGDKGGLNTWHSGSLPGTNTLLVRRHDGLTWVALFNQRSKGDGEIDGALHRAADAVTEWPKEDLFPRYVTK
jgi:CubicO group peptidase (beta-lactamase class C family)